MFLTKEEEETVTVTEGKRTSKRKVHTQVYTMPEVVGRKMPEEYDLDSKDILYINVAQISADRLNELMSGRINSKGLILDMRQYPQLCGSL